ncbi:MAG: hypothetical protein HOW73_17600 [Polyangiaceae bacterium]|nr:hypothetical protein [Polyangiaceae bacterium]
MSILPSIRRGFAAQLLFVFGVAALAGCGDDTGTGGAGGEGAGGNTPIGGGNQGGGPVGGEGGVGGDGGSGGETPIAPPLRNPVDMPDETLAVQSLLLMGYTPLGAPEKNCTACHAMSRGQLNHWKDLSNTAVADCFADTSVPTQAAAEAVLACLRQKPTLPVSPYMTEKLGIYATAAHLDWFGFVFDQAFAGAGDTQHAEFVDKVGMPKNHVPFTQGQFDIVAEWFARGLPLMEQFIPDDPKPGDCTQNITPDVLTHVNAMQTAGWRAENAENNILMFGCAGAATAKDCLSTYPTADEMPFSNTWDVIPDSTFRILRLNNYSSSYWTRSSADGRFVAHGGGSGFGSTIVDLQTGTEISANASYDPGFFPDNSGFVFQGAPGGAAFCHQSILNSTPSNVTFNEPECNSTFSVGLYQHVGAALGGGDYWAVDSLFVSDDGGHGFTGDNPAAWFDGGAQISLTPMIYDGSGYTPKPSIAQSTPYEGDTVISPSSGLLLGRVAGNDSNQNGFRLRKLVATPSGGSYTVSTPEIGRYCINGGKPAFSYDERWVILHRYVTAADAVDLGFSGPNDPAFIPYLNQGAANIYLLDVTTGQVRRVTNMKPGQYALFPHFRSDGWIYFMLRTGNQDYEYIVASDAALTIEEGL